MLTVRWGRAGFRWWWVGYACVCACALTLAPASRAADGDPVAAFGQGGIVRAQFDRDPASPSTQGQGAVVQPDEKIVVVGATHGEMFAARYTSNGDLDTTFGIGGIVRVQAADPTDSSGFSAALAVVLQPDGKIVLAGYTGGGGPDQVAAVRLNADGSRDTSFAAGGIFRQQYDAANGTQARAIALDGPKIVLAGTDGDVVSSLVVRLNADGTPDASFGTDGVVNQDFSDPTAPHPFSDVGGVAVDRAGRILVGGAAVNAAGARGFEVVRLTSTGSRDPGFGDGGATLTDIAPGTGVPVQVNALTLAPDGEILLAGQAGSASGAVETVVERVTAAGSPDPAFGAGGVFAQVYGSNSDGRSIALQPNGRILVTGLSDGKALVLRLDGSGTPDPTFGAGGAVVSQLGLTAPGGSAASEGDWLTALADGTALIVGSATGASTADEEQMVLERVTVDQPPAAAISAPPGAPIGTPVPFSAAASDPDGTVVSLRWGFGDGSSATGSNATHAYASPGTYRVTLTATDDYGVSTTVTQTFAVPALPTCRAKSHTRTVLFTAAAHRAAPRRSQALHRFTVTLTCAQGGRVSLGGKLTFPRRGNQRRRTFLLRASARPRAAGQVTLRVTLPAGAVDLLRAHRRESSRLTVVVANANGATSLTVKVHDLKARRRG